MSRRRRSPLSEVSLDVGGVKYEFQIDGYVSGSPGSYWDPPDAGEVEIGSVVTVYREGGEDVVTFETAVLDYALDFGVSVEKAESAIYDRVLADVEEYCAQREGDD